MDFTSEPHRCPKCHALVVDRRSPNCTTCRTALPAEWILTREQSAKLKVFDAQARAEFKSAMRGLNSIHSSSEIPPIFPRQD